MKRCKVGSRTYNCLTLSEVANLCGRKPVSLRKLMERKILPEANIRDTSILIHRGDRAGEQMPGKRLYTEALAKKLAEFFQKNVRQGSRIDAKGKQFLIDLFSNERKMLEE